MSGQKTPILSRRFGPATGLEWAFAVPFSQGLLLLVLGLTDVLQSEPPTWLVPAGGALVAVAVLVGAYAARTGRRGTTTQ